MSNSESQSTKTTFEKLCYLQSLIKEESSTREVCMYVISILITII